MNCRRQYAYGSGVLPKCLLQHSVTSGHDEISYDSRKTDSRNESVLPSCTIKSLIVVYSQQVLVPLSPEGYISAIL